MVIVLSNDSIKTKIIILIISIIYVLFVIFLYFIDKELKWSNIKIISCIIFSIYAFFAPPMIKYICNWFKTLSMEESFYAGYKIGYYGIIGLILMDPIIGIMYYFNKKFIKNKNGNGRFIVMVGWYLF